MEKIIIVDIGVPDVNCDNSIFDIEVANKISHTLLPICHFVQTVQEKNMRVLTPEKFYLMQKERQNNLDLKNVYLISHLVSQHTEKLLNVGVIPLLLMCQESPYIATRFYLKIKSISSKFKYTMVFSGLEKFISKKTKYIKMHFPLFYETRLNQVNYKDKKTLIYIGSNKSVKGVLKRVLLKIRYGTKIKLVYPLRSKIMEFFAEKGIIEIYGKGWNTNTSDNICNSYKGLVGDKLLKTSEYKFSLCLENAFFPGYITEKIFDAFLSRTVPIYLGDGSVNEEIPKDTFVYFNDYKDLDSLHKFMMSIDEDKYNQYQSNIDRFIESESFIKYTHQRFTNKLLELLS